MIDKCKRCGKEELIYAKGMSHSCYVSSKRDPEKCRKSTAKWRKAHPEYHRDYQRKKKGISKYKLSWKFPFIVGRWRKR